MTTIIERKEGGGAGVVLGILIGIILIVLFFVFALPEIRGRDTGGAKIEVQVPTGE